MRVPFRRQTHTGRRLPFAKATSIRGRFVPNLGSQRETNDDGTSDAIELRPALVKRLVATRHRVQVQPPWGIGRHVNGP
jgi:hypothetical protein